MAVLESKYPTLLDISTRKDPNGELATSAALLTEKNPILQDMPWKEGNREDGTVHTGDSALATASWKKYNAGTAETKSSTTQYTDSVGIITGVATVDAYMAEKTGNVAKFRADEEANRLEGMNQELANTLFYGNITTSPEEFTGIAPRYAAYGSVPRTSHVFNAGAASGQTDVTSIYLVGWGLDTVSGLYGKNGKVGMQRQEFGKISTLDSSHNPWTVYRAEYNWECGLSVVDYRYIVRIANIDVSDLLTTGDPTESAADILKFMTMAKNLLPSTAGIRPVFYCHPDVLSMFEVRIDSKPNMALTYKDITDANGVVREGVASYKSIPIRAVEQISLAETLLTA
jgi:hypothetical protein